MNMTSEEPIIENTPPATEENAKDTPAKMSGRNVFRMMQKINKMRENPDTMRRVANFRRAQAEFNNLMSLSPEQRSRILFTGQVYLMSRGKNKNKREVPEVIKETAVA